MRPKKAPDFRKGPECPRGGLDSLDKESIFELRSKDRCNIAPLFSTVYISSTVENNSPISLFADPLRRCSVVWHDQTSSKLTLLQSRPKPRVGVGVYIISRWESSSLMLSRF